MRKIVLWVLAGCISTATLANVPDVPVAAPELTAAQIVEKNVAARGGLDAWRKIQAMVWIGHIENANPAAPKMSFVLEQKRPNRTRFEIKSQNQMSLRIYDGTNGWRMRPSASGKPEVQPFTNDELRFAQDGQGIDGPLMDYAAKGVAVTLDGVDEVEGRKAYRLNVRLPSGVSHHVWIDAQNFLDIKYDRQSRNTFGQSGTVSVFYRDYQTIEGLQIPLTIETGTDTAKAPDRMVIDKITLNPPLEDQMFAKPRVPGQHKGVTVKADAPQASRPAPSLPTGFPRLNP